MDIQQTSCKQCGVCCTKGGAALHSVDIALLNKGLIPRKDLVTIRKGEFAYNPVTNRVQATKAEIIKLRGTGKEWVCCYYDPKTRGCTIYDNRPMACGVLKCWEPEESLSLVERDLLSRYEIVSQEDTLKNLVTEYDLANPLPDCTELTVKLLENSEEMIAILEDAVNCDLQFRDKVVTRSIQILEEEMFLFGRPLFQLLQPFGLLVMQSGNRLILRNANLVKLK
ncbi:MAG: YkgJ family cysteine cluster protein [Desulfocapsa sp.]|nr:YkgJ family cysteine cluster protein [Desulfocapsa sp.]